MPTHISVQQQACRLEGFGWCIKIIIYISICYIHCYCMKRPKIKAPPKCTSFSIQCFISQGQRSLRLTGLATAPCEHHYGQLTSESQFQIVESSRSYTNAATINQLKYRSRTCITGNIALRQWSLANKALGCTSCFIASRPHPRAIFYIMHSHGTLTSIKNVKSYQPCMG